MAIRTETIPTFHRRDFGVGRLLTAKSGRRITVCLPARNEAPTVGTIVRRLRRELVERHPLIDELIVVDDGSKDGTADVAQSAGARVVASGGAGKGVAMRRGVEESSGELVAFCDADVRQFDPGFVLGLVGPLLVNGTGVALVKGCYDRACDGRTGQGGRVTELVAKPLLRTLFPELSSLRQPLAGECAGRRDALERLPFVAGYGVDIALLIDVAAHFGTGAITEVDLGERVHRNRPLEELSPQAEAVLRTVLARAGLGPPVTELVPLAVSSTERSATDR